MNREDAQRWQTESDRRREQMRHVQSRDSSVPGGRSGAKGTWVKRDADIHRCTLPTFYEAKDARKGDIWECAECGDKWVVAAVNTWDDQRDPGPYGTLKFTRYYEPYIDPREVRTNWQDR